MDGGIGSDGPVNGNRLLPFQGREGVVKGSGLDQSYTFIISVNGVNQREWGQQSA